MSIKITRTTATDYAIKTDTMLADGSFRSDGRCRLNGNVLKSHEQRGDVRTGGLFKVTLGDKSFARVSALTVGESVEFNS